MLLTQTPERLKLIMEFYKNKKYLVIPDLSGRTIHVALAKGETSEDVIAAYYHAVMLALTLCVYNGTVPVSSVFL